MLERVREAVQQLASRRSEIEQVLLFGSLARGDAGPGSDVDLLVLLQESSVPFLDRAVLYRLSGVGIGVDIFAYTREEFEEMMREGNSFLKQALREGILLYERAGSALEDG